MDWLIKTWGEIGLCLLFPVCEGVGQTPRDGGIPCPLIWALNIGLSCDFKIKKVHFCNVSLFDLA